MPSVYLLKTSSEWHASAPQVIFESLKSDSLATLCIAVFDQDVQQASSFSAGKESADSESCRECQSGVYCCSMYWRTVLMGAPPHEEAK